MKRIWLIRLDQTVSSYSILVGLLLLAAFVWLLYESGLLGWVFEGGSRIARWALQSGFHVWEGWLSWANWGVYLALAFVLLLAGGVVAESWPWIALVCALLVMFMGVLACLAYMFIDVERYEVQRGRMALFNPTKGQELAANVAAYGHAVGIPLLAVAAAGIIGAFALLNQALYESIGRGWYHTEGEGHPALVDFLAYGLIHLFSLVDVLDLADSRQLLHASFVRKGTWQAAVPLAIFRSFFTFVLLQQIFASVRQGRLLAETIADFWSPHEPIHDRARNTLPQFGANAIDPLLASLGEMTSLTREQRDQLPKILATIGPTTIPSLAARLTDPREHVRAVAASALGHLCARELAPQLAALAKDPSEHVRLSAVDALGAIAAGSVRAERSRLVKMPKRNRRRWVALRRRQPSGPQADPIALAVASLQGSLSDPLAIIRSQAALALGRAGVAASNCASALSECLRDSDENVRCRAAEALGAIGGSVDDLLAVLDDETADVRAAAARGLKSIGRSASRAVPRLIELLQDRDESVRAAATEAIAAAGPIDDAAAAKLANGMTSTDTTVRAQTAEALGTLSASAESVAPVLVEALSDGNDHVRAKAAEALGKIGKSAAEVALPSLVRALRDPDSWVSALAAEALGEMGGIGRGALPGLVRALTHVNSQVRANSAEAIGKMGPAAAQARSALERAARDDDGDVRAAAVQSLGAIGAPDEVSLAMIQAALADANPRVRAAAVQSLGASARTDEEIAADLVPLLRDPNDEVKIQAAEVLSRRVKEPGSAVDGLSQALAADDSPWVRACMAQALSKIGPAAAAAGPILLQIARTDEAEVREQAMRTLAMIQPPEAAEAFIAGMADSVAEVRVVASAGWIKSPSVPRDAVPALIDALRDPEMQVRANAAHALGRLESLPSEAIPGLRECASDPNDGLRLNAAVTLQLAPANEIADIVQHLLEDPNVRIRLVAARSLLERTPGDPRAVAVVESAADDPSPRVRQAIEELSPFLTPAASDETGPAASSDSVLATSVS